jgi:hypothetical protein
MPSRFAKDAATPRRHAPIHQTHSPGKDHDLRRHNKRPGFVPSENENGNHTTVAINVPGLGDVSHGQVSRWNRQSKTDEFREGHRRRSHREERYPTQAEGRQQQHSADPI